MRPSPPHPNNIVGPVREMTQSRFGPHTNSWHYNMLGGGGAVPPNIFPKHVKFLPLACCHRCIASAGVNLILNLYVMLGTNECNLLISCGLAFNGKVRLLFLQCLTRYAQTVHKTEFPVTPALSPPQ